MIEASEERRLTTILAADVVGYSRLMAGDETGTLASLKAIRRELIEPKTVEHRGRIVKLIGDGTLMEFGSVVDAVRFAVDVQRKIAERNVGVPEDRRIAYRMGINIGDIIVEGEDIYGDGVNIASRLEELAEPGSICVARNVYNQVEGKVDVAFEDLGEREVKNIPKAVQVYRVLLDSPAIEQGAVSAKRTWRWHMVAGGLAVLVIAAGIALWQRPWEPHEEPASEADMAFPLPDKPSIAVMPFDNMSNDPEQEFFADGMAEDLITDLSKISSLFVISRNSAFTYKGKNVKVRQVAEELGVRYVLEGSVRRVGDEVRINAQLIDATTGGHLWAERYDGTLADVFDLQDKVTERIVDALALELTPQEARRVGGYGTDNVEAYDAYLLALNFYYRRTPNDYAKAKTHLERAIELDPDYSAPYTVLAKMYAHSSGYGSVPLTYAQALGVFIDVAAAKARKILAKVQGEPSADFHVVRSWLALKKHQHERAIAEAERALELSPNSVDALEALAKAQIFAGQPETGIKLAHNALRQNPAIATRPYLLMGLAEFALGNPDKAAEHMERAFALGSEEIGYASVLAAVYGELDRIDQAETAFDIFRQGWTQRPNLGESMISSPFLDRAVLERLADGLARAGVSVGIGRYMPLYEANRLRGSEIEALLFGRDIEGREWWQDQPWQRRHAADGAVVYSGFPVQSGIPWKAIGSARIEDDMICEVWSQPTEPLELCSVVYRIPEGDARIRWGDYVLVTDGGPNPFKVVN